MSRERSLALAGHATIGGDWCRGFTDKRLCQRSGRVGPERFCLTHELGERHPESFVSRERSLALAGHATTGGDWCRGFTDKRLCQRSGRVGPERFCLTHELGERHPESFVSRERSLALAGHATIGGDWCRGFTDKRLCQRSGRVGPERFCLTHELGERHPESFVSRGRSLAPTGHATIGGDWCRGFADKRLCQRFGRVEPERFCLTHELGERHPESFVSRGRSLAPTGHVTVGPCLLRLAFLSPSPVTSSARTPSVLTSLVTCDCHWPPTARGRPAASKSSQSTFRNTFLVSCQTTLALLASSMTPVMRLLLAVDKLAHHRQLVQVPAVTQQPVASLRVISACQQLQGSPDSSEA